MAKLPPALRPWWPVLKRGHTAVTELVAGPAIAWSAARNGWLPRSTVEGIDPPTGQAVDVVDVRPAETIVRTLPVGVPGHPPPRLRETRLNIGPQRSVTLPHGRVLGPARAVVTADGTLLHGFVRYFGTSRARQHPVFLHPRVGPPERVAGDLVVLASRGDGNYYHFLHDVLPRLATAQRAGHVAGDTQYYVPRTTRFQRELVELVGLARDRVVDADAHPHVTAERLIVPTVPDLDLGHPEWATAFLRERLLPTDVGPVPGRRVYVTRGRTPRTRIVRNEGEVLEALTRRGFEVVDPATLSVAQQIRTFAEAEFVVAPHGAALASIAFAPPGSSLVELFAPDFVQGCYWKLATTVPGLRYRYLVGRGGVRPGTEALGVSSDIDVDVGALVGLVDEVLVGSRPACLKENRR